MSNYRFSVLFLLISLLGASGQGHSQTKPDPFVEAARKREAAAKVVDITFKLREISPRGSAIPGAGWAPGGAKEGSVLETDLVLESTNRLVFQGAMVRIESNHPIWNAQRGKPSPEEIVSVSNKSSAKTFFPKGRGTNDWPSGILEPGQRNSYMNQLYLLPVRFAYRGTNRLMVTYSAGSLKPSGKQPIGGKECREYSVAVSKEARTSYFADPELDYNVVRIVTVWNKRVANQFDINYEKNRVCEWVPVSWVEHNYSASGSLEFRREVEVVSTRFNEALPDDQFDVVFPPGTQVHDQRDRGDYKQYRVQGDGQLRLLSPDGEELSTVLPQGNTPWYRRYVWWFICGGAAILLLLVLLLRKRRLLST